MKEHEWEQIKNTIITSNMSFDDVMTRLTKQPGTLGGLPVPCTCSQCLQKRDIEALQNPNQLSMQFQPESQRNRG